MVSHLAVHHICTRSCKQISSDYILSLTNIQWLNPITDNSIHLFSAKVSAPRHLSSFIQLWEWCWYNPKQKLHRVQGLSLGFILGIPLLKVMESCYSFGRPHSRHTWTLRVKTVPELNHIHNKCLKGKRKGKGLEILQQFSLKKEISALTFLAITNSHHKLTHKPTD